MYCVGSNPVDIYYYETEKLPIRIRSYTRCSDEIKLNISLCNVPLN